MTLLQQPRLWKCHKKVYVNVHQTVVHDVRHCPDICVDGLRKSM